MILDDIVAQPLAVRTLNRALDADRLASAYLFEGPSGVGKFQTALALAEQAIASGSPDCAKRIQESKHPDVRVFASRSEGSGNLPVDFVRDEVLHLAQFAPFEATRCFMIFRDADVCFPQVHPESANAMLKTLEEPRPGLHFILVAERPDRLLQTIRSRCQRLRFRPLPQDAVQAILEARHTPKEEARGAAALCGGRVDRALELLDATAHRRLVDWAKQLHQLTDTRRYGDMIQWAEEVIRAGELKAVMEVLIMLYRNAVAESAGVVRPSSNQPLADQRGALQPLIAAERVATLISAAGRLEHNANAHIVANDLALNLCRAHLR